VRIKKINSSLLKLFNQLAKFTIVGFFGIFINYLIFIIFLIVLDVNYLISGFLGYLVPAIPVFLINRYWTFKSNISISKGVAVYFLIDGMKVCLHAVVQLLSTELFLVPELYSQGIGICFATVLGFILVRMLMTSKL